MVKGRNASAGGASAPPRILVEVVGRDSGASTELPGALLYSHPRDAALPAESPAARALSESRDWLYHSRTQQPPNLRRSVPVRLTASTLHAGAEV
ncbi:hypothetical protein GBF38_014436 [Nibea albiflora]|uniref:Uncharacterized protein n=1 Tax=Nibea albiflora TaxID=240163 RepID=A0ACB7F7T0_NIBAL|nr:hypothetical protein GBF38_014436 [Nibea albiflora]